MSSSTKKKKEASRINSLTKALAFGFLIIVAAGLGVGIRVKNKREENLAKKQAAQIAQMKATMNAELLNTKSSNNKNPPKKMPQKVSLLLYILNKILRNKNENRKTRSQ